MNYLQLPDHAFKAKLSGLELLIYADVWTMQLTKKGFWKSNGTLARQFGHDRRSVIRAIRRLETRGFLVVEQLDHGRLLTALIVDAGVVTETPPVTARSLVTETPRGGDRNATGGVTQMVETSDRNATQIDNNREVEYIREERRGKPRDFGEVERVFDAMGYPELATRFFNHWEMRGWKVAASTRLHDWKAAARKFIEDEQRFTKERGDIRRAVKREKQRSQGGVDWENELRNDVAKHWNGEAPPADHD